MPHRFLILIPWISLTGCALGPGSPFAVLEPWLAAEYLVPSGRDAGDGWQRLDNDFQVRLSQLEVELAPVALQESSSAAPLTFDPANPPPGYTLCHNGHCDREDGALVPYEEVQAELDGGARGPRTIVSLTGTGALDALAPALRALACEPGCDLPYTELTRVGTGVTRLTMAGQVRDGRASPRLTGEVPWRLEVTLAAPVPLRGDLSLRADNDAPLHARLEVRLRFSGRQLDGLAWDEGVQASGLVDLSTEANAALRARLLENLATTPVDVEVTRG